MLIALNTQYTITLYFHYLSSRCFFFTVDFKPSHRKEKIRLNVLTSAVTSALDRTQTSDRFAAHLIKKTVKSTLEAAASTLGNEDIRQLSPTSPSRSILRRANRQGIVYDLKSNKLASDPGPFLLHWDGKLLPDTPGILTFLSLKYFFVKITLQLFHLLRHLLYRWQEVRPITSSCKQLHGGTAVGSPSIRLWNGHCRSERSI